MRINQGKRKAWTKQEDEKLIAILKDPENRLGCKSIGKIMNRGGSSILLRAKTLGFKPNKSGRLFKYDKDIIQKVGELKRSGMENKQIGRELNLAEGQVHYIITRNQLSPRNQVWTEEQDKLFLECIKNEMTLKDISKKFMKSFRFLTKRIETIFGDNKPEYAKKFIYQEKNTKDKIIKTKLHFSKTRAEKEGWDFNLTYDHILELIEIQNNKCYYSGEEIAYQRYNGNCISFDRIDSDKGYTKDNVVLCCWDANRMKQDMKTERLLYMCEQIFKNKDNIKLSQNEPGRWNLNQ